MHTANTNYIYKNDLDKGYFKRNIAYEKYEDLKKRTKSDKVFRDKAFKLQATQNLMDIKED